MSNLAMIEALCDIVAAAVTAVRAQSAAPEHPGKVTMLTDRTGGGG